ALPRVVEVGDHEDPEERRLGHDQPDHAGPPAPLVADGSGVGPRVSGHSCGPSGSSGCFRSHRGRRLPTTGTTSKLYSGGGEVVAHSRVQASHGSSPARSPLRSERTTFTTKKRTPSICSGTPAVVTRFHHSHPRSAG